MDSIGTMTSQIPPSIMSTVPSFLLSSSFILFVSTAIVAHAMAGFPKSSLGNRSHGVVGYDAILGCFPSHFQVLFHCSYSLFVTGLFLRLLLLLSEGSIDDIGLEICILPPIMFYMVFYLSVVVERSKTVSKPGGE